VPRAEEALARAERHVREGEERLARQAALVERIAARGLDSSGAEIVLERFRTTLELWRDDLRRLRAAGGSPS